MRRPAEGRAPRAAILLLALLLPPAAAAARERLVVAIPSPYPPLSFVDESGRQAGYLVEFWRLAGERAGVDIDFLPLPWAETLAAVASGRAQVHGGLFQTAERARSLAFSDPLIPVDVGLFVAEGLQVLELDDLGPRRVGTVIGSFEESFLRSFHPDRELESYGNFDALADAAASGALEAFALDLPAGTYLLGERGAGPRFRVAAILASRWYHAAVARQDRASLALVKRCLEQVPLSERSRLLQKWLVVQRVDELPPWLAPLLVGLSFAAVLAVSLLILARFRRELALRTKELREANDRLRGLLDEKELMLREIHHRVKNNLAVTASLLSLQASMAEVPETAAVLEEARSRIHTMALLYDRLYRSTDFRSTELAEYLGAVIDELSGSLLGVRPIRIERDFDPISVDPKKAVLIGIVLAELVTNACKYAFPAGRAGRVLVRVKRGVASLRVSVEDDGVGFPEGFDPRRDGGFGLSVVRALASQLGGDVELGPGPGVAVSFEVAETPGDS